MDVSNHSQPNHEKFMGAVLFALHAKGEYEIHHIVFTDRRLISVNPKRFSKAKLGLAIANIFAEGAAGLGGLARLRSWKKNKPQNPAEVLVSQDTDSREEAEILKLSLEDGGEASKSSYEDIIPYDKIKSVEVKDAWGMGTTIVIKTGGLFGSKNWAVYPSVDEMKRFLVKMPIGSRLTT